MAVQLNQKIAAEIALRYAEVVKTKYNISYVYLFGSVVSGAVNEESDIDIAVISNEFTGDIVDDVFELMKLRRNIDIRIEPHPILKRDFIDSNPFARQIMSTGVLLT